MSHNETDVYGLAEKMKNALNHLVRVGTVCELDLKKHTARVKFPEDGGNVSWWLAVIERNTFLNRDHQMPDLEEDVLCLFLPGGGGYEDGFILGSFYAGEVEPPSEDPDERRVVFSDDAYAVHHRKNHTLDFVTENTSIHVDREKIVMETPKQIHLISHGTIDLDADGDVNIHGANINLNC